MADGKIVKAHGKIQSDSAPFMSTEEAEFLTEMYQKPKVILEYGSGGSTRIAAALPNKLIFSVESDLLWALELQAELDAADNLSPATIYPVDIGPVGPWGRPLSDKHWRVFPRYPCAIWDEPFFRHPDLILIDGRMRTACFIHAMLRIEKPVTVLFDDYGVRKLYRQVERLIKPKQIVGTLAHFELTPDSLRKQDMSLAIQQFFWGSIHGGTEKFYDRG